MNSKNVQEVVARVQADPAFAKQVEAEAREVARRGFADPLYDRFMAHFAVTPEQLARLKSAGNQPTMAAGRTTTTTITTVTTAACLTTTTTTTTTDF